MQNPIAWFSRWCDQFRYRNLTRWSDYPLSLFAKCLQCNVPLEPYLGRFAKQGQRSYDGYTLPGYAVYLSKGLGYEHQWGRYRDAEYGLILTRWNKAAAVIAWDEPTTDGELTIRQIQGVQGATELLLPLRWEKLMYQLALDWAAANGMRRVYVIRAEDSRWYHKEVSGQREKSMHLLYDVTARRMGFRRSTTVNAWVKEVG